MDEDDGGGDAEPDRAHRPVAEGEAGELRVRGVGVFREYLNKPEATAEAFDEEGWFMTGDIARFDPEVGSYQILGRASVDIIKSAGYKISALEVERSILEHPDVAEVTVVGVEDEKWGQRLCAVVRRRDAGPPEPPEAEAAAQAGAWLREWLAERVAPYRVPSAVVEVAAIPKNAMGKVNKKAVAAEFFGPLA